VGQRSGVKGEGEFADVGAIGWTNTVEEVCQVLLRETERGCAVDPRNCVARDGIWEFKKSWYRAFRIWEPRKGQRVEMLRAFVVRWMTEKNANVSRLELIYRLMRIGKYHGELREERFYGSFEPEWERREVLVYETMLQLPSPSRRMNLIYRIVTFGTPQCMW